MKFYISTNLTCYKLCQCILLVRDDELIKVNHKQVLETVHIPGFRQMVFQTIHSQDLVRGRHIPQLS